MDYLPVSRMQQTRVKSASQFSHGLQIIQSARGVLVAHVSFPPRWRRAEREAILSAEFIWLQNFSDTRSRKKEAAGKSHLIAARVENARVRCTFVLFNGSTFISDGLSRRRVKFILRAPI